MSPHERAETYLRVMRVQRVCRTLEVDADVAALLCELADRVAELESELGRLRDQVE